MRGSVIGACRRRKITLSDSFWAKKKDSRFGVVHWISKHELTGFYVSRCGFSIRRREHLLKVSYEQIVFLRRCKNCVTSMVKEENDR